MCDYSVNFVWLPLKTLVNNVVSPSESVHTDGVDVGDGPLKESYETTHHKHVVEIQQMFKPVKKQQEHCKYSPKFFSLLDDFVSGHVM